jgi:hypothetical protein
MLDWPRLTLSFDGGIFGSEECKQGCSGSCGGVCQRLQLGGVGCLESGIRSFVGLAGVCFQSLCGCFHILFTF